MNQKICTSELGSEIKNELITFSNVLARELAYQNLPKSKEEFSALYYNPLKMKIQAYIHAVNLEKTAESQISVAKANELRKNDNVRRLRADLTEKQLTKAILEESLSSSQFSNWDIIKFIGIKFLIFMISFAESFMVYRGLSYAGIGTLGSMITSVAIGAGLFVVTDYAAYFIRNSKHIWIAWVKGIAISMVMYTIFYAISLVRVVGSHNEAIVNSGFINENQTVTEISPAILAIISTSLFIIGVLLVIFYGMSKSESQLLKEYIRNVKKRRTLKRDIHSISIAIKKLEDDSFLSCKEALENFDKTRSSHNLLAQLANEAMTTFISVNLRYRTDGYCPDYFANPLPFEFSYFSTTQKPHIS